MTKREIALVAKLKARIRELEAELDSERGLDEYYPASSSPFVGSLGEVIGSTLRGIPPPERLTDFPKVETLLRGKPVVFDKPGKFDEYVRLPREELVGNF